MATTKKPGRGTDEFRATYDKSLIIPAKFRAALAELGDAWETEGEFVKRVGCSQGEFGEYRPAFEGAHVVEVVIKGSRKRVWAGTKAYAAKLRGIIAQQ